MRYGKSQALAGWIFIMPSLLILLFISVIPIFMSLGLSFTKYNIINPPQWVGFANYARMAADPFVRSSVQNSLVFTLVTVPIQTALSLVLATLLANMFRGRFGGFVKSALFIPVISSGILVASIWSFFLATENGLINQVLGAFGIPAVNWLGQTKTALLSLCIIAIWKSVGYFLVIYYAGIMEIPASILEAAEVDGASRGQQFMHITMPHLRPIHFLVVTLGTIWAFQMFDLSYAMTGGGPGRATVTLVMTIYNAAFKQYNMGYASTVAFLLFAIILAFSLVQKRAFREKD